MRVYVGDDPGRAFREELRRRGWGIMSVSGRPTAGFAWAFDNGAYGWARRGECFGTAAYLRRLAGVIERGRPPDFAILPDLPQLDASDPDGGRKSLDFSLAWLDVLPAELRWFLAVQDGMTPEQVAPHLDRLAGLFLGGSNAFKRTAGEWAALAHSRGRGFHYARASTMTRIRHALSVGADSCDSCQLLRRRSEFHRATRAYYGTVAQGVFEW